MNVIENFLLDFNLSWTTSKYLPVVLIIIVWILIFRIILNFKALTTLLKITIGILVLFLSLTSYFIFNPVYTGDIYNGGEIIETKLVFPNQKKLIVIALSDCQYCHQSIEILNKLTERNPKIQIEYWLTGSGFDAEITRLKSKQIVVKQNSEIEESILLTEGVFPTFVLSQKGKLAKRWTNQSFGSLALDEIESFFD
jgi:hypothetical protein